MNKRILKTYLNKNGREDLKNNCFKMEDKFIFSDSYGIIILNSNCDYNVLDENNNMTKMLNRFYNNFNDNFKTFKDIEVNDNLFENKAYNINKDYSIDLERLKRIKNIINANKIEILKSSDRYCEFVIKAINEKTKEEAFLLPQRNY